MQIMLFFSLFLKKVAITAFLSLYADNVVLIFQDLKIVILLFLKKNIYIYGGLSLFDSSISKDILSFHLFEFVVFLILHHLFTLF